MSNNIAERVEHYYSDKLRSHGPTPSGVDWNSVESQELRFHQLARVYPRIPFSLNDYGCGYGALLDWTTNQQYTCEYFGYDLSPAMIHSARQLHNSKSNCTFFSSIEELSPKDVTVASGLFNVKLDTSIARWEQYVLQTLDTIARCSQVGFAFNMLTIYSDQDRMRSDLYYGDPCQYFDHCKRLYSKNVALLHDYGLYEFTIVVRNVV